MSAITGVQQAQPRVLEPPLPRGVFWGSVSGTLALALVAAIWPAHRTADLLPVLLGSTYLVAAVSERASRNAARSGAAPLLLRATLAWPSVAVMYACCIVGGLRSTQMHPALHWSVPWGWLALGCALSLSVLVVLRVCWRRLALPGVGIAGGVGVLLSGFAAHGAREIGRIDLDAIENDAQSELTHAAVLAEHHGQLTTLGQLEFEYSATEGDCVVSSRRVQHASITTRRLVAIVDPDLVVEDRCPSIGLHESGDAVFGIVDASPRRLLFRASPDGLLLPFNTPIDDAGAGADRSALDLGADDDIPEGSMYRMMGLFQARQARTAVRRGQLDSIPRGRAASADELRFEDVVVTRSPPSAEVGDCSVVVHKHPDREITRAYFEPHWVGRGRLELCPSVTFGRLWGHVTVGFGGFSWEQKRFALLPNGGLLDLPASVTQMAWEVRPPSSWKVLPAAHALVGGLLLITAGIASLRVRLAFRKFTPAHHDGAARVRFEGIDTPVELPEAELLPVGPILVGGPPPSLIAQLEGRYHVKRTPQRPLQVLAGSLDDVSAGLRDLQRDAAWACCASTIAGLVPPAIAAALGFGG